MNNYIAKIIAIAQSYVGQQEIQPNRSFKDAAFLKKMISVGWQPGQSWCAYFFKLVWLEAYADNAVIKAKINQHGCGGAMNTFENYKTDPLFKTSMIPLPGAGVIFEDGKTWNGHAGIVIKVLDKGTIQTIEGNTNTNGSREGYEVAVKTRALDMPYNPNGLNIKAFIYPPTLT
jgi:hypothetical protein